MKYLGLHDWLKQQRPCTCLRFLLTWHLIRACSVCDWTSALSDSQWRVTSGPQAPPLSGSLHCLSHTAGGSRGSFWHPHCRPACKAIVWRGMGVNTDHLIPRVWLAVFSPAATGKAPSTTQHLLLHPGRAAGVLVCLILDISCCNQPVCESRGSH